MQWPRRYIGIERIIDRKDRHIALLGARALLLKPALVLASAMHHYAKPDPVRRKLFQAEHYLVQIGRRGFHQAQFLAAIGMAIFHWVFVGVGLFCGRLRQYDQQQILQISGQIIEPQYAPALVGPHIADRQQPRQPPPSLAVFGISHNIRRTIGKDQAATRDQPKALRKRILHLRLFDRDPRAHHAGNAIAVGNTNGAQAKRGGLQHHIGGMRCPAQEGVIGRCDQLRIDGVLSHANNPCRYQIGVSVSEYRPWRNSQKRRPSLSSTR